MKLLVSDYDGTLNPDKDNVKELKVNISAVRKLMETDKFMISTGRAYESIKKEINKHNIPYDYLSCNDGAILFDKEDNIINYLPLDSDFVSDISNSNIGKNIDLYGLYGKSKDKDKILEVGISSNLLDTFKNKKLIKEFISKYDNLEMLNLFNYFIVKASGGKSRSIKMIDDMEHFDRIITVGDNYNDLEMLKDYEGYKLYTSYPSLYFKGINSVSSVKSLIKKISK